ncbi:transcription initiation factor IIE subunit beta [Colletotrichum scovillei]|uniref:Transcription initiation factor IIE subunit beta n=1 Tax=Colletotrichum scovillei TaxID=1209932 RepID=A0A9P7UAT6_9PEZI|nr:transcription initiation factor IIE subunit beta [Colletotrichum scovillei]KAG7067356.1 transcription initiation factor IIE subunit beta [Colletotrichum scovillei]
MSSLLEKQKAMFSSSLASAASKLQSKSTSLAPPSPSPSVSSMASASKNDTTASGKRKRDPNAIVYSQPQNTSFGQEVFTQMQYALEWLKGKDEPKTATEIFDHLGQTRSTDKHKQQLVEGMRRHPRIQWVPDPKMSEQTWRTGTYVHRPIIPGVKDKMTLLRHLQSKRDAEGTNVKDLKDGWPDCDQALMELEREHKILIVKTKKEQHPRAIWLDDATLHHHVDDEFKRMWNVVEVPSTDDIVKKLVSVGQKPASADPSTIKKVDSKKQQKKRAVRRTGKTTNTHMEHLLKDYSHMRRETGRDHNNKPPPRNSAPLRNPLKHPQKHIRLLIPTDPPPPLHRKRRHPRDPRLPRAHDLFVDDLPRAIAIQRGLDVGLLQARGLGGRLDEVGAVRDVCAELEVAPEERLEEGVLGRGAAGDEGEAQEFVGLARVAGAACDV